VEEVFDAVVVATGHYSQPKLPSIKGNIIISSIYEDNYILIHVYGTLYIVNYCLM
jgi:hypothetical protein